jgi:superfamily II DNA/RNA helicase
MPQVQIQSRLSSWPKERAAHVVNFDMPNTLKELVEKFGEEVIAGKAIDSITIDVQALVRRALQKEGTKDAVTAEALQKKVDEFKPSSKTSVRRSPVEKVSDLVSKMTEEEKKALLAQLKGK